MKNKKNLVCVTGLPGAGKSLFCEIGNKLGYQLVIMGNQIRKEAKRRSLNDNTESLTQLMIKLRDEKGKNIIAEMCIDEINKSKKRDIIIDGIRNIEEIELFSNIGDVKIVLINNTSEQRIKFLRDRKRSDAPINKKEFNQRDKKELEIGLDEIMKRADIIIENTNLSKEEYIRKSELILNNLLV